MDNGKFIVAGEDKKTLTVLKNILVSNGHVFTGYLREPSNLLRCIRTSGPDFLIVEVANNFIELKRIFEMVDEEILSACVMVLNTRKDEIIDFIKNTRVLSYIIKPFVEESVIQVTDMSLLNYRRILEYERKVKKLNETIESRKIVEKAKWILVEKEGFTEEGAYDAIRRKSRDNRIPMKDIAEAIILTRG